MPNSLGSVWAPERNGALLTLGPFLVSVKDAKSKGTKVALANKLSQGGGCRISDQYATQLLDL